MDDALECQWLDDYRKSCRELGDPYGGWCKPCYRSLIAHLEGVDRKAKERVTSLTRCLEDIACISADPLSRCEAESALRPEVKHGKNCYCRGERP